MYQDRRHKSCGWLRMGVYENKKQKREGRCSSADEIRCQDADLKIYRVVVTSVLVPAAPSDPVCS